MSLGLLQLGDHGLIGDDKAIIDEAVGTEAAGANGLAPQAHEAGCDERREGASLEDTSFWPEPCASAGAPVCEESPLSAVEVQDEVEGSTGHLKLNHNMLEGVVIDAIEAFGKVLGDIDAIGRVRPLHKRMHVTGRGSWDPAKDGVVEPSVSPVSKGPDEPFGAYSPCDLCKTDGACLARDLFIDEDCFNFLPNARDPAELEAMMPQ